MQTRVWFNLLDRQGQLVQELDQLVTGGSITEDISNAVSETGTIKLQAKAASIDWMQSLIQPWREVDGNSWPMGTYVPEVPVDNHSGTGIDLSVTLSDKTSLLQLTLMPGEYSIPAGADVREEIVFLIAHVGLSSELLVDSLGTTSTASTWDPGTSVLTIINQLLSWHGWRGISTDGWGRFIVLPARDLRVTASFLDDGASYTPEWDYDRDLLDIPNEVHVFTAGNDTTAPVRGYAVNNDPDDPLSIFQRSRVSVFISADYATAAEANARAAQELTERGVITPTVTIKHPWQNLELGSRATFRSAEDGVEGTFKMIRTTKPFDTLTLPQTTMIKVVS